MDSRIADRARQFFNMQDLLSNDLESSFQDTRPKPVCSGSKFQVGVDSLLNSPALKWHNQPGRQAHAPEVLDFLVASILWNIEECEDKIIHGFTEYRKGGDGGPIIFRAHPSYRANSRQRRDVWFDWALFDLSGVPNIADCSRPGQIMMFFHMPSLTGDLSIQGIDLLPGKPHATVRLFQDDANTDFRPGYDDGPDLSYSYFIKHGYLHRDLFIIPCDLISEPTIVVENLRMKPPTNPPANSKQRANQQKVEDLVSPLDGGFFVIQTRKDWAKHFVEIINSFQGEQNL